MKEIKERLLDKYSTNNYSKIIDGVYLNKKEKNYCFAYECILEKGEGQYPLEDLLDNYHVHCSNEYCGDEIEEDGIKKSIVEIETLKDDKDSLMNILCYSTIVNKTINNIALNGKIYVASRFIDGKVIFDKKEYTLPMYGVRISEERFNTKQWEYHFIRNFNQTIDLDTIDGVSENTKKYKLTNIVFKDRKAYVNFIDDSNKEEYKYDCIVIDEKDLKIK